MAARHAAAAVILAALTLSASAPAQAQSAQPPGGGTIGTPGNIIIPPELLPDLAFGGTSFAAQCTANRTLRIDIHTIVKNKAAKATADLSKIPWQIAIEANWFVVNPAQLENPNAKTVKPQLGGPKTLGPGAEWKAQLVISGVPAYRKDVKGQGLYNLTVDIDPMKGVLESNETNNHLTGYVLDPCPKQ